MFSFRFCLLLLLLSALCLNANSQSFALHDGDRVAFYGDSITAQRFYTRFVEDCVLTRYPQLNVEFWNVGVPGDTVKGGYTGDVDIRLKRDVLPRQPNVVTVMLGINDAGWGTFHQDWFEGFLTGYQSLLSKMQAQLPGVRFTLIRPTPYDELTHGTEFPAYNSVVTRYADGVSALARDSHTALTDFNAPVENLLRNGMRENHSLAKLLMPDRIHPAEAAHWVMAAALVRAWGISPVVSRVRIDAVEPRILSSENTEVTALTGTATSLRWTQLDRALPLPLNPDDPMTQFLLTASDLAAVDQQTLAVQSLKSNRYTLKIDGKEIASFTKGELASGINIALYRTPMVDQSREVDGIEVKRTHIDETHFWLTDEGMNVPGIADADKTLDLAQSALASEQREKVQPKPHTFELTAE